MILNAIERAPDNPSGPPLVLLHGLLGQARNFGLVQRHLAHGRRVLALDLRNHGCSPHQAGMEYATLAQDVFETLTRMEASRCILLGHSMGGKVAMRLALDHPEMVAGLVIVDIAPRQYLPRFRPVAQAMLRLDLSSITSRSQAADALSEVEADPRVRAFLTQGLEAVEDKSGRHLGWRIGLSNIARGLPDIEGWDSPPGASFNGPALFMAGALSPYIKAEDHRLITDLCPQAQLVTLPAAGHWVHADQPDQFVTAIETFIAGSDFSP
ncbi:alpha/beta fold hydrolase [Granulibacter bethesdensis]|uniref:alpha/beta fold hydrolase n=1 Tax=Granulibacter bethesdensis TaxID=364410 RepID=UPI00090B6F23|nr:alpha/beta fold hydrolase [Granulibacter bethesdensis]APH59678.1 Esterase/Lipase [Granulibacter bethesdensis]